MNYWGLNLETQSTLVPVAAADQRGSTPVTLLEISELSEAIVPVYAVCMQSLSARSGLVILAASSRRARKTRDPQLSAAPAAPRVLTRVVAVSASGFAWNSV